jgi:hypothetical protein
MLSVMGAVAEFERSLIRERQREGIALAKQHGVYWTRGVEGDVLTCLRLDIQRGGHKPAGARLPEVVASRCPASLARGRERLLSFASQVLQTKLYCGQGLQLHPDRERVDRVVGGCTARTRWVAHGGRLQR